MHRSPLFTADSSVSKSPRFSPEPPVTNPSAYPNRVAVSHVLNGSLSLLVDRGCSRWRRLKQAMCQRVNISPRPRSEGISKEVRPQQGLDKMSGIKTAVQETIRLKPAAAWWLIENPSLMWDSDFPSAVAD